MHEKNSTTCLSLRISGLVTFLTPKNVQLTLERDSRYLSANSFTQRQNLNNPIMCILHYCSFHFISLLTVQ